MEPHRLKDDDEAVRAALSSLKTATGIPVTMYGTLLPDNRLQITQWVGLRTPALQNLIIDAGVGVGGRVVSTRRAVGVSDYSRATTISHENDRHIQDEGLHSIVAVPVTVQREIRGVLYVGVHSPVRLGDKVIEEVTMTARCLEQDLAVNSAMRRADGGKSGAARGHVMNGAEWEQVRSTHPNCACWLIGLRMKTCARSLKLCATRWFPRCGSSSPPSFLLANSTSCPVSRSVIPMWRPQKKWALVPRPLSLTYAL